MEDTFNTMPLTAKPKIQHCTLTSSLLQLCCLNQDLKVLDLMDLLNAESIATTLKSLFLLGMLSSAKVLTPLR